MEPFGGRHEDLRWGFLLSLFQNANMGKDGTATKPWTWFESLKDLEKQTAEIGSPEAQKALMASVAQHNAAASRVKAIPKKKPVKKHGRHR